MHKLIMTSLVIAFAAIGCTANVEKPTVDQTGRSGDTKTDVNCTKDCDGTKTTCVAACNDNTCKAACSTDHDECVSGCTITVKSADAG